MFGLGFPELLLLLILFGFLVLLVKGVKAIVRAVNQQSAGLKSCPFCAERIQAAAVVCRFCNRDVAGVNVPQHE